MGVDGGGNSHPTTARQQRRQLHQPASVAGNAPRRSRSPQRHRGTESVQQPVSSTIAVLIDAELGRYLAPAVVKDIRKQPLDLSDQRLTENRRETRKTAEGHHRATRRPSTTWIELFRTLLRLVRGIGSARWNFQTS